MMCGYVSNASLRSDMGPRRYRVIARDDGWSIVIGDACTRPFPDRKAALRIARQLQSQANRLFRPSALLQP